eukprot:scaffold658975_cov47-Prasinocladus_malaysianus.AAC.1
MGLRRASSAVGTASPRGVCRGEPKACAHNRCEPYSSQTIPGSEPVASVAPKINYSIFTSELINVAALTKIYNPIFEKSMQPSVSDFAAHLGL